MFAHLIDLVLLGWDFRRLSDNDLLAACKFPMRTLDMFIILPIAGGDSFEGNKCLQGDNQCNLSSARLNTEIPSLSLGQKLK